MIAALLIVVSCQNKKGHEHHPHQHEKSDDMNHHKNHHHGEANEHMHQSDIKDLIQRFESPERDAYQQPEKVLEYMGNLQGLDIFEIGAGSGYFSFKMVEKGAHVIAGDVDDNFQAYMQSKKDSLGLLDNQLELRKLPYDAPNLQDAEVDKVLIVNTYHHIENRANYFAKVLKGLKPGGELIVIDFFKKEIPMGPPVEMKISAEEVQSELKKAGFQQLEVNDELLEYQYIIRAKP